jgi:2-polyprenyl-3-methyl-5-hydroxy-6-metoxy-1,4-benzoquinol methylase
MTEWTNAAAIRRWDTIPRTVMEAMENDGDFAKRHLVNPVLLRLLGDVWGARVLDAGCGNGYFSRMLAERGATVVGVEPAGALYRFACEKEAANPQGIQFVQADLCDLPDLGKPFDAVVASMVLASVPDWTAAMRACVSTLAPGGLFVLTVNHPCFERLRASWQEYGEFRIDEYLAEYEIEGPYGIDFHRTLSSYLNELIGLGCRVTEIAEPGLDVAIAATGPAGVDAYAHLPNFLVIAARRD